MLAYAAGAPLTVMPRYVVLPPVAADVQLEHTFFALALPRVFVLAPESEPQWGVVVAQTDSDADPAAGDRHAQLSDIARKVVDCAQCSVCLGILVGLMWGVTQLVFAHGGCKPGMC